MAAFTFNNTLTPLMDIPSQGKEVHVDAYNADVSGTEDVIAAVAGSHIFVKRVVVTVMGAVDGVGGTVTFTLGAGETTGAVTNILTGPVTVSTEITAAGHAASNQFVFDYAKGRNKGRRLALGLALTIDSSAALPLNVLVDAKVCRAVAPHLG